MSVVEPETRADLSCSLRSMPLHSFRLLFGFIKTLTAEDAEDAEEVQGRGREKGTTPVGANPQILGFAAASFFSIFLRVLCGERLSALHRTAPPSLMQKRSHLPFRPRGMRPEREMKGEVQSVSVDSCDQRRRGPA